MGTTIMDPSSMRGGEATARRRPENLALVYQEILTAVTRLRSNRQAVDDAQVFRTHMRGALSSSEADAVARGYLPEDVRLATFAIVAFLDESVLNSPNPAFADWSRLPLQEEMFGHHVAGEVFFQNLEKLQTRTDSHTLADVLEVYQLCLLLGYKGRYSLSGPEALRPVIESVAERIRRARGQLREFSPSWAAPKEAIRVTASDHWVKRLVWIAAGCALLALLLFGGFKLLLTSAASGLQTIASQGR